MFLGIAMKTVFNNNSENMADNKKIRMNFNRKKTIECILSIWKNKNFEKRLFDLIISPRNLKQAWFEIQKFNNNSVGRLSSFDLIKVYWDLKNQTYKYKLFWKIGVFKQNKIDKKMRSLISLKDKLVQHAFKRILQIYLEGITFKKIITTPEVQIPKVVQNFQGTSLTINKKEKFFFYKKSIIPNYFSKHSHGSHFNKSCHTALASINKFWKNINYFLNIDIKKTLTTLNGQRLFNILEKLFEDQRLIEEFRKMVNAKIIHFNAYTVNSKTSSINSLSCLLFNIYMTKFDYFIEKLINLDNKDIKKIQKKPLIKVNIDKILKKTKLIESKALIFLKKKRETFLENKSKIKNFTCCLSKKKVYIYYIRYLDTLLFGIKGSKFFSSRLKEKIIRFINKELHFTCIKIELRQAGSSWINYLGFLLQIRKQRVIRKASQNEAIERFRKRTKKNTKRIKEQYLNSSVKLSKLAFFDQIYNYSKEFQLFMNKRELKKVGIFTAQKELLKFFQTKVKMLYEIISKTTIFDNIKHKAMFSQKIVNFKEIKNKQHENILSSLGRELRILGKTRIEQEGKSYLYNLLGPSMSTDFKSCIKFSKKLDQNNTRIKLLLNNKIRSSGIKQVFSIYIKFPKKEIMKRLIIKGLLNYKFRPTSYKKIINATDFLIIDHFNKVAQNILNYYSPCLNFWDLRSLIDYHVRYSLLATLGHKHKGSITTAIKIFGKDPKLIERWVINYSTVNKVKKERVVQFITAMEIAKKVRGFRSPKVGGNDRIFFENSMCALPNNNIIFTTFL